MSKPHPLSDLALQDIATQLACPHGEVADKVADAMADSNRSMIEHTVNRLQLQAGQRVLEIGHGGADHLSSLFTDYPDMHYSGLELSPAMHRRALSHRYPSAALSLYDGKTLPDFVQPFARIFSVNTLYFWQQPAAFLNALYNILAPDGLIGIGYGCKDFMLTLPFVGHGFTLYDEADINRLIAETPFTLSGHYYAADSAVSKSGEPVERRFCTTVLHKEQV